MIDSTSRVDSPAGTARAGPRAAPSPVPASRHVPRVARNARPTATAPIRPALDKESPMFDVDNKSAVERLAAVVAMLEGRETEARQAYGEVMNRFYADESAQVAWRADEIDELGLERHCARAKRLEAQSALAAARELTRDL